MKKTFSHTCISYCALWLDDYHDIMHRQLLAHQPSSWLEPACRQQVCQRVGILRLWILPVYEVSCLADVLVLNSIEF